MNKPAVVHEVFSGATLVPHNDPSVIYEDTIITSLDCGTRDKFRFQATQVGTIEVQKRMNFERFFEHLSESYKASLTGMLNTGKLPEIFYERVRAATPGAWFHALNSVVWFFSVTTFKLRLETFTKMMVEPGIYDSGKRIDVDFVVNSENLYSLRTVKDASSVATNITG